MADQLILGGFIFEEADYSIPTRMEFGGSHAMIVHKLPGGTRVTDMLGPDEDDISWSGFFYSDTALAQCQQLDAMRAAGTVVQLTFGGMARTVVIKHFKPRIRRYPNWCEYEITCVVTVNPANGAGAGAGAGIGAAAGAAIGAATADALIANDLATAAVAAAAG
jgi:hypothetical protein